MTAKRFTINDCRVLSNEQVFKILNQLTEDNEQLKQSFKEVLKDLEVTTFDKELLEKENKQLKQQLQREHTMLDNAILLERTRMGQNSLKQYKEAIQ